MAARRTTARSVSRERRTVDAEKTRFSITTVAAIVVWVLALAAQWYGMQGKFAEINTALSIIAKQMEGDGKLAERDAATRDARIRELEVTAKAYEIRIRQLETENARRGAK